MCVCVCIYIYLGLVENEPSDLKHIKDIKKLNINLGNVHFVR